MNKIETGKFKKDKMSNSNPKENLSTICNTFLTKTNYENAEPEIEVRFGTRGIRPLNKIDFDNVVKKIKSLGFYTSSTEGNYSLKIENEFLDIKTGEFKRSNIRVEIEGIAAIREYCKNNDLELLSQNASYYSSIILRKKAPIFENNQMIRSADFDDFNFRVTYSGEETIRKNSKLYKDILENWLKNKKTFRYINRVSWVKPGCPFRIDLSIVKSSTKEKGAGYVKTYNTSESNVFNNPETYEIEIELLNSDAKLMYKSPKEMVTGIEQVSKYVLSGLQGTNFPISYKEQNDILSEYMKLLHGDNYNPSKRVFPSDFLGPSSKTLQIKNIAPINTDMVVPNIRNDFVVTDKADGSRNLLFVNQRGRIYLINMNMSVIFTGAKTDNEECFHSILDGELILHNKLSEYINLYAAFDIYFVNKTDLRALSFVEKGVDNSRLNILQLIISSLNAVSILGSKENILPPIRITTKKFYPILKTDENENDGSMNIFDACNYILRNVADGLYEYTTDGLIFTHSYFGVGSNQRGKAGPLEKKTWDYSFKWKPSEFNTIDFLVTTKKSANGDDVVTPIFENGLNTSIATQYTQYKTLVLRCGFDENKHGYINPCQDVLDDKWPVLEFGKKGNYRPVQFFPSNPYNPEAGLCNLLLEKDDTGNFQMFTEERQVFTDGTIIEFRYDLSREGLWRWVPLRVRYDKTNEYKQGLKNYGNAYNVADDNWYSIHNPITKEMISTGNNIPDEIAEDDIYYNKITNGSETKGLRDFHNLFVKKLLIQSISKRGDTLIDFACGKGGDLPKWIAANLSFVFGIDISKDNLENRINGACARFLNYKKDFKNMPYALFVNGNSALNIRSGEGLLNDKAIQITKAVFGHGSKTKLGSAVERQYGKGENGFDISSCQFAIHYMFENNKTLHQFLRNIAECTRLNGYFIGTCYDGKTIFNKLIKKEINEGIEIYENDKKIWQIIKQYPEEKMEDEFSCIGYKIQVYQESINKLIPEYLVNFDYLTRVMEDYGFVLIPREDAKRMGLPESSGMFIELFNIMMDENKRHPNKKEYGEAAHMTRFEKEISFLNRYFVYKKVRSVDAEKVANSFLLSIAEEVDFDYEPVSTKAAQAASKPVKPKVKKLNRTLILKDSSDSNSDIQEPEKEQEQQEEEEPTEIIKLKPKKTTRRKKPEIQFDIQEV